MSEGKFLHTLRQICFYCCVKDDQFDDIEYDANQFDYIVEKFVVSRVPIALFATKYDIYNTNEALFRYDEKTDIPVHNANNNRNQSMAKLENIDDIMNEPNASISEFEIDRRANNTNILSRLSSVHSELKDSDGILKDTCNEINVPSTRYMTSKMSALIRENLFTSKHYMQKQSIESGTSCDKKLIEQIHKDRIQFPMPTISPVKVHHFPPKSRIPSNIGLGSSFEAFERQSTLRSKTKGCTMQNPDFQMYGIDSGTLECKESVDSKMSKSEESDDEAAGTKLRWRIIIKHHQDNPLDNSNCKKKSQHSTSKQN